MKLFVTATPEKAIGGYEVAHIMHGGWNFSQIPNDSQSDIVALNAIDFVEYNHRKVFVSELVSKLRRDAKLVIVGIEAYELINSVRSRTKSIEEYNNIIGSVKSMGNALDVISVLRAEGLKIDSLQFKGEIYEITTGR